MKKSSTGGPNRSLRYSAADKLKISKLFAAEGYTRDQLYCQLHVSKSAISAWAKKYREHGVTAFTTPFETSQKSLHQSDQGLCFTVKWTLF